MNTSRRHLNSLVQLSFVCLLVLVTGCQKEGFRDSRNKVPVIPVTGKVLVDGEKTIPPGMVKVVMHPDAGTKEQLPNDIPFPSCWVEPDGTTFNIGSYLGDDGAPVGNYKVTFEVGTVALMSGKFGGGALKGKYKDPEDSKIEVTITGQEESIDLGTIELTSP